VVGAPRLRKVGVGRAIGVSGTHAKHHTTPEQKARAKKYRQSDAGRQARKFYNMRPEVKLHHHLKAEMKRHLTGR
jgi:hypothetical protein